MEQFANNPTTTLTAAITSTSATSLTVASAGAFPSSGNFRILIDGEILKVTGVSGTTWTVARGDGSSIAATHLNGAPVYQILTAEALNALTTIEIAGTAVSDRRVINFVSGATAADNSGSGRCDITIPAAGNAIGYGVGASRPAAGNIGNIYVPTNGIMTSIDTGSVWVGHNPFGAPFTIPPVMSGWTKTNSSGATYTDVAGGGITAVFNGSQASTVPVTAYRTVTSGTSYTVTACFQFLTPEYSTSDHYGLTVTDGTKTIIFGLQFNSGLFFCIESYTALTSPTSAVVGSARQTYFLPGTLWLQIQNDGTHRTYRYSLDGQTFSQVYQEASGTFLTETAAGFGSAVNNNTLAYPPTINLLSWSGTT